MFLSPCLWNPTPRRIWYFGIHPGIDVVRGWRDLDGDTQWDPGEPQNLQVVRWHDRVAYAGLGDSFSSGESGDDDGYFRATTTCRSAIATRPPTPPSCG